MTGGFIVKWFLGPFGDRLKHVMLREVGYCSDMEVKDFRREVYSVDRLYSQVSSLASKNLFFGVGFWLASDSMEPDQSHMYYDRIVFDFDSEEDPGAALGSALDFAAAVSNRHHVDVVVFRSGFKGAHVVIPLSKPTTWRGYQLLWDYLYSLVPEESRRMVDPGIKQWNRLDRVPFTYNIRGGVKRLAEVVHPRVDPRGFDWSRLRGLDPGSVTVRVVPTPRVTKVSRAERRGEKAVAAPCMVKLLDDARSGVELPHSARLALASYMLRKGFTVEEVVEVFTRQPDFSERVTRYQVEYIARRNLNPYNCDRMREFKLCVGSCGVRNPLGYRG